MELGDVGSRALPPLAQRVCVGKQAGATDRGERVPESVTLHLAGLADAASISGAETGSSPSALRGNWAVLAPGHSRATAAQITVSLG